MSQIEKPCSNPLECCYQTAGDQNTRITAERSTQQTGLQQGSSPARPDLPAEPYLTAQADSEAACSNQGRNMQPHGKGRGYFAPQHGPGQTTQTTLLGGCVCVMDFCSQSTPVRPRPDTNQALLVGWSIHAGNSPGLAPACLACLAQMQRWWCNTVVVRLLHGLLRRLKIGKKNELWCLRLGNFPYLVGWLCTVHYIMGDLGNNALGEGGSIEVGRWGGRGRLGWTGWGD